LMLYCRAGNVTLRPPPPRRSQIADPKRKKLWFEAVARPAYAGRRQITTRGESAKCRAAQPS
jgi:hypothetical protein